jgi:hypothetical protein
MVYLDGPWGLDYSKSQTTISSFVIDNIPSTSITDDQYAIEETHPLLEKYLAPGCVQTFCRGN